MANSMVAKNQNYLPNDSARNVAVNALLAFHQSQTYIQDSLADAFTEEFLDQRDRRLATELALGACRRLITLDHLIAHHSSRPLKRIEPAVLQIIRVGLYQLIYLTGAPPFAAVDQAVRQANAISPNRPGGFVNALLRSVQRDILDPAATDTSATAATCYLDEDHAFRFKTNVFPDPTDEPTAYWALALSHPLWLIKRWLKRHNRQTVLNICHTNNARPPLTLRANSLRCTGDQLIRQLHTAGHPATRYDDLVQLDGRADPRRLPGFHEGLFTVQDATAAAVAPALEVGPGDRILDLCAAPGGKATHLAELTADRATIVACDVSRAKLDLINQNIRRLGLQSIQTCLADELPNIIGRDGLFDAVLVDAPCSNTGVMARRCEVRHLLTIDAFETLAANQLQLLGQAAAAVKPRGKILYSTCSIEPSENEDLIQKFLASNNGFILTDQNLALPCRHRPWRDGGYTASIGPT